MRMSRGTMKVKIGSVLFLMLAFCLGYPHAQQRPAAKPAVPAALLPEPLVDLLIDEVSGEIALDNERLLASFEHKRPAEEFEKVFAESKIVHQKLQEYGIRDCGIEEVNAALLGPKTWNAESAELWIVEPEKRKITDLTNVPACLAEQSRTSDVTAELVDVGAGSRDDDYRGTEVRGKIVLASGRGFDVHEMAVARRGAVGIVIAGGASNSDYDPDEVGRDTLARNSQADPADVKPLTFGFMISARQGAELGRMLAAGKRIVLHATCRTKYYPSRNELVWALIKGSERPQEELVFTAHLFEEMAYQGANDNASGSVSILETARVLQKLVSEGKISLKRSVRFLWVEEGAGTLGYLLKYPEVRKRIFANINEDMVGESLHLHFSSLHLTQTPHSRPTFLNDVLANFFEYVGETNRDNIINRPVKFTKPILSPAGTRDPFTYHIDKYSGGSDHAIFLEGGFGIPAVQLGVWPDLWYHTNLDRPDKSDSTQLKRAAFIATAAAVALAGASTQDALLFAAEVLGKGLSRIGADERRAAAFLAGAGPGELADRHKEARNIVRQAFLRENAAVQSTAFFAPNDAAFAANLRSLSKTLSAAEAAALESLAGQYRIRAAWAGVAAAEPAPTPDERRLAAVVPRRTELMSGYFDTRAFLNRLKGKSVPDYTLGRGEDFEIRNFIDGARSVLDIRNAVSAEIRPIPLRDVENYFKALEATGMVTLEPGRKR